MSFRINHYSASGDHRSTHLIISIHNVTPIEVRKWRQLTSMGMFLRRIFIDQQVYLQFVHLSLNGVIIYTLGQTNCLGIGALSLGFQDEIWKEMLRCEIGRIHSKEISTHVCRSRSCSWREHTHFQRWWVYPILTPDLHRPECSRRDRTWHKRFSREQPKLRTPQPKSLFGTRKLK